VYISLLLQLSLTVACIKALSKTLFIIRNARSIGFWFLVCYAAIHQLHQERIQVVRSKKVVRRVPIKPHGNSTMDLGFEDMRIRRYTNKRGTAQNTNPKTCNVHEEHSSETGISFSLYLIDFMFIYFCLS